MKHSLILFSLALVFTSDNGDRNLLISHSQAPTDSSGICVPWPVALLCRNTMDFMQSWQGSPNVSATVGISDTTEPAVGPIAQERSELWALRHSAKTACLPQQREERAPFWVLLGNGKWIHWQENWRERPLKTRPGEWVWNGRQKSLQSLLKQVLPSFQEMRYGVWNPL